ncbi:MAG TPA: DNA polymerase III subunit gamma/tau, partial [Acidimicrobiales bacterium]|nr:DNA polymerase III subunit gamma/tau [Acidimicrobiales bacterium]
AAPGASCVCIGWDAVAEETPYQALYRRFRPQRFDEVLGQEHVSRPLRAAVRDAKVAHAYLFSGPRGTGKTSTARILAMALNCEHPVDGEPDGTCESCVSIRQGSSLDVQELDSATNRGIDEMKDLLSRVSLGTPGRWKVYIVDEVHQLTSQAASALLKTLEEPPGHVIFVLATTDPQKVLPTIRSRTQHFEFRLLGPEVLGSLLADVNSRAALGLPSEAIDLVVKRGQGSARDALSALDQVAAAGGAEEEAAVVADIVAGLGDRDPARVLTAVAEAAIAGRDPRRIATEVLEYLRNGFLAMQARSLVMLADEAAEEAEAQARRLGTPALVRAMEVVGQSLIDMRDAPDPRITLEVALIRVASPEADDSRAAILERLERLERSARQESHAPGQASPVPPGSTRNPAAPRAQAAPPIPGAPPTLAAPAAAPVQAGPKAALGAHRKSQPAPGGPAQAPPARAPSGEVDAAMPASGGALPTREELTIAWGDAVLPKLRPGVKVYVAGGRFLGVEGGAAVYALPDRGLLGRAEPLRPEIEGALSDHFGCAVPLRLVLDQAPEHLAGSVAPPVDVIDTAELGDISELEDAPAGASMSPEQRLLQAFPGAEEVS